MNRANEFKFGIAGHWIDQLHVKIPELEGTTGDAVDKLSTTSITTVRNALGRFFPGGKKQKEYLDKQLATLSQIREEIKDVIGEALLGISRRAPAIHDALQTQLQKGWDPAFNKAKRVKAGRAITRRRHDVLIDHAMNKGKVTFKKSAKGMEDQFKVEVKKFPDQLKLDFESVLAK